MTFEPFHAVVEVPFDKNAHVTALGDVLAVDAEAAIAAMLPGIDDLIVIAHGWNNDIPEARALYQGFFAAVGRAWSAAGLSATDMQRCGILAVYWPSKRFDEADLIAGGAAAIEDTTDYGRAIAAQIGNLKDSFGQFDAGQLALLDAAANAVPLLDTEAGQNAYVAALGALFPRAPGESDPGLDSSSNSLLENGNGSAILQNISTQVASGVAVAPGHGGGDDLDAETRQSDAAVGRAAGFNPLGGVQQAANLLLNLTTYYIMKERGGVVGSAGAAPLVARARAAKPELRVHLVGHSFGGRLVTSLASALPDGIDVQTMALLQAAFSHYGLAPKTESRAGGAFRNVITSNKVRTIIQITHSAHDWAVGAAYPIASFISRDVAGALPTLSVPGTADSLWGGMGASGAQQTPEASDVTLLDGNAAYDPLPAGKLVRNLAGDAFISGHGDVDGAQVAWAFLHGFVLARA